MENNILKIKLNSLSALKPETWKMIDEHLLTINLLPDQIYHREVNSLIFVKEGLIQEYDWQHRNHGALVGFFQSESFICTNSFRKSKLLQASVFSKIIYLSSSFCTKLTDEFPEFQSILNEIQQLYEVNLAYRMLILEKSNASTRIEIFVEKFREILPLLRKKDIANYLAVEYDYFIRIYGKHL